MQLKVLYNVKQDDNVTNINKMFSGFKSGNLKQKYIIQYSLISEGFVDFILDFATNSGTEIHILCKHRYFMN